MVVVLEDDFHGELSLCGVAAFDKDAFSNVSFQFMERSNPGGEWLNYHHLRYFHAVAREGGVRRASERLRVSQPSISAQVTQLEASLGAELFRRSGRALVLTDFGRLIYGYADEIFALGTELLTTARRAPTARAQRVNVGVVDSFPKLLSLEILRPAFARVPAVHVTCQEGKLDDLLGQLAAHRLDGVLADEPPPSSAKVKTFTHPLGSSGLTFCAAPVLARKLRGRFPRNLHHAPMLLPTQNTALRRDLEKWFREVGVEPAVVGEFEDAAFAKIVATEGIGVTVVPTVVVAEAIERYGFVSVGRATACQTQFFLITAERRIEHPVMTLLAGESLAAGRGRRSREAKARPPARK